MRILTAALMLLMAFVSSGVGSLGVTSAALYAPFAKMTSGSVEGGGVVGAGVCSGVVCPGVVVPLSFG